MCGGRKKTIGYLRRGAILVLAAPLLVTACGKTLKVGPFGDYVTRFEADSQKFSTDPIRVNDLIIEFADAGDKPAHCTSAVFKTPRIAVNQKLWQAVDADTQELTLLHEMGHCVLGRKHLDGEIPGEARPVSVMATELMEASVYEAHRDQYLTELFSISPRHPLPSPPRP